MAAAPSTTAAADTGASAPVSATAAKPAPAVKTVAKVAAPVPAPAPVAEPEQKPAPVEVSPSPAVAEPAEPVAVAVAVAAPVAAVAIDWPITVELVNNSGISLSLMTTGLFIGPASSASIVLRDEDGARRIRAEVMKSAAAAYIGDKVFFESFPNIKG